VAWLALGAAGGAAAGVVGVAATVAVVRAVAPRGGLARGAAQAAGAALGLGWLAVLAGWVAVPCPPHLPDPLPVVALAALALAAAAGPLAGPLGALYASAYRTLEARPGLRRAPTPPGVRPLARWLGRRRDVVGALLVKEMLTQARTPFNWARAAAVVAYLVPFPWVAAHAAAAHLGRAPTVVGYFAAICLLSLIDAAPSPIGAEGNRLALFLVAPVGAASLLRAKLLAFLAPVVALGLSLGLLLGVWTGLPPGELLVATAQVALIAAGATTLLTLGSVWDAEPDLAVEGAAAALLVEQLPGTARRLGLVGLCLVLLAGLLQLAWRLPPPLVLPSLALADAALLGATWPAARRRLRALPRRG
jgi:hypothetical protein